MNLVEKKDQLIRDNEGYLDLIKRNEVKIELLEELIAEEQEAIKSVPTIPHY